MVTKEEQTNQNRLTSYKEAPWCNNPKAYQNIVFEDEDTIVFKDGFPVTEGHLLFVPKKVTRRLDITRCFELAYEWGVRGVMDYRWEAFNVGINNGVAAGQSVMWPHVHLIPRRTGDTLNPKGGVRNVIPLKGDYDGIGWGKPIGKEKNSLGALGRSPSSSPSKSKQNYE